MKISFSINSHKKRRWNVTFTNRHKRCLFCVVTIINFKHKSTQFETLCRFDKLLSVQRMNFGFKYFLLLLADSEFCAKQRNDCSLVFNKNVSCQFKTLNLWLILRTLWNNWNSKIKLQNDNCHWPTSLHNQRNGVEQQEEYWTEIQATCFGF